MLTKPLLAMFPALVLGSCSGIEVDADYDPAARFASYQTYAWPASWTSISAPPGKVSELVIERVHFAIDSQLAAKGLRKASEQDADLLVAKHLSIEEKVRVPVDPYYAFSEPEQYEEGTLVIDFIDAKRKRLVWRGTGQTKIRETTTPEERDQRVREVVTAILDQYPPKPQ